MQKKYRPKWPYVVGVLLVLVASAIFVGYSSIRKNRPIADDLAAQFHAQLNSEQFDLIYSGTTSALQRTTKKEEFLKFLTAVHTKLGKSQTSTQGFIQVNATTN